MEGVFGDGRKAAVCGSLAFIELIMSKLIVSELGSLSGRRLPWTPCNRIPSPLLLFRRLLDMIDNESLVARKLRCSGSPIIHSP